MITVIFKLRQRAGSPASNTIYLTTQMEQLPDPGEVVHLKGKPFVVFRRYHDPEKRAAEIEVIPLGMDTAKEVLGEDNIGWIQQVEEHRRKHTPPAGPVQLPETPTPDPSS